MNHLPSLPSLPSLTYEHVVNVVGNAIAEVSLLPLRHVMSLDDMTGLLDSVQSLEVVMLVEREFGVSLDDEDLLTDPCIAAICSKLFRLLSARGPAFKAFAALSE